ncbi:putative membrane transporter protein YfcA [bioreactor metagenome]|uniref:Putative membrane transporter protein YfcA n=1 Tax=bioreactor metagenome TaxID=1076179 RepID=A0A644WBW7_9ZZZZ
MNVSSTMYLIVCPLVFLAGFVDSIAGGGGLISLPAYLLAGLPAHYAIGTNKTAMSIGTFTAAVKYLKAGQMDLKVGALSAAGSFLGAFLGSSLALMIADNILKMIMLAVLPAVAIFLLIKKDFGAAADLSKQVSVQRLTVSSLVIGLVIGCYDGLIGPGTGTFFILTFTAFLGFDLLKSSGCAKAANLASNVASMIVFSVNGKVLVPLALPAALFAVAGNYCGARLAISGRSKYVRYVIFFVIGLLFLKMAAELI